VRTRLGPAVLRGVALAAASCASPLPKVEHEIVGRVQGVEPVAPEKIVACPRHATPPPGGVDRIAWLRVRWARAQDRDRARRAIFEEASRFGADVILDYEERVEFGEATSRIQSSRWPEAHGNDGKSLAFLGAFLTLAAIAHAVEEAAPPERGSISGCAARTR